MTAICNTCQSLEFCKEASVCLRDLDEALQPDAEYKKELLPDVDLSAPFSSQMIDFFKAVIDY